MQLVNPGLCHRGFHGGSEGKESTCNAKIPWRRAWQPTPVSLPGESHGQRSLVGYSPWDLEELDTTDRLSTRSLSSMEKKPGDDR